ncbi:MAG: chromosomal replication initiator protein DnaA [Patescibacteria group bacterium]|jgi:chromosomal replication initiator protein
MDLEKIWNTALGELEVVLSKANYITWFKDTFIVSSEDGKIVIGVPNGFAEEWLSKKFHPQIFDTLKKTISDLKEIEYKIIPNKNQFEAKTSVSIDRDEIENKRTSVSNTKSTDNNLNPKYVFENFIVSNTNRLAQASSIAVANNPGMVYNPLFIYGGVGLGKTHLLHGIGHEILRKWPEKKVVYLSCEKFTNEFIHSISTGKINEFKKTYRNVDVLLVDDIQFLSNKEGFQEEFFHTFNSLHQTNRQIVMTADRMPKAIPALEERLSSRFGWGLIADIQSPNFETRMAILQAKCKEKGHILDEEVLKYIAQNVNSNIRELEGCLNRLITSSELTNVEINLKNAESILADFVNSPLNANISINKVFKIISDYYEIKIEEIMSEKRNKELVRPRQVIMYILRNELNLSYPKIAKELNGKDHTTIMYGVSKIKKELARDETLKKDLVNIKEKLYSIA